MAAGKVVEEEEAVAASDDVTVQQETAGERNGPATAMDESDRDGPPGGPKSAGKPEAEDRNVSLSTGAFIDINKDTNFQLAIYIAMAHAGLVLVVLVLYGVGRLLKDFWKPIQWAVLCSMPLREVQEAIVAFWSRPLEVGFVQFVVAPPIAVYEALLGTVLDAKDTVLRVTMVGNGQRQRQQRGKVGFAKIFQWLVSFAFFVLGLEFLGPGTLSLVVFVGLLLYAGGTGFEVKQLATVLSSKSHKFQRKGGKKMQKRLDWALEPVVGGFRKANQWISRPLVRSLHTLVAVGLITTMILGTLGGLALFSYKVGMEGKDAMYMVKVHLEENDYAEAVGTEFNKWVEENRVPELIDTYVVKGYDALVAQVDTFAEKNNITEFVDVGKELLMGLIHGDKKEGAMNKTVGGQNGQLVAKLRQVQTKVRAFEFQGLLADTDAIFHLFLDHFQLKREDFLEKVKQVAQRSTDVGRKLLSSGTSVVQSGASFFIFFSSAIASGAAELINFVTQLVIFFSVLYYLITSRAGGVMEQMLEMVPLSVPTRISCAKVLDHAVSSVLLATVKVSFFQASFTWLLFRLCDIHFLYLSTLTALIQAFLPLFPSWLASLPLAIEFALNRRYVVGIMLMCLHGWVMDYGADKIHSEIPGHNAYLTGLSIAGGMAFFSPALEGAIMGPLLMTVLIACKNLYAEFVLSAEKVITVH